MPHGNVLTIQSSNANGVWMTYQYDALNRLSQVYDKRRDANCAGAGITTYSYDATGNLSGYAYPNTVRTTNIFDAANNGSPTPTRTPKICGGTFSFGGMEADAAEAGAFTGVIYEHDSIDGNLVGNLTEVWGGGEGVAAGGGKITSPTAKSVFQGFLGFVGAGLSAGPLAGIQVGYAGGNGWGGLYVEGHLGHVAWGGGGYLRTSCKAGG